jgi:hypothetical protein
MSITVIIARDDIGAPSTSEIYALGAKFNVDGGDLSIFSAKPQLVALYPSGNWQSVHVDNFVEIVSVKPAEDEDGGDFAFGDDDSSDSSDSSDTASTDDDPFGLDSDSTDTTTTDDDDPFGLNSDSTDTTTTDDDDPFGLNSDDDASKAGV